MRRSVGIPWTAIASDNDHLDDSILNFNRDLGLGREIELCAVGKSDFDRR